MLHILTVELFILEVLGGQQDLERDEKRIGFPKCGEMSLLLHQSESGSNTVWNGSHLLFQSCDSALVLAVL